MVSLLTDYFIERICSRKHWIVKNEVRKGDELPNDDTLGWLTQNHWCNSSDFKVRRH
jgi:hypothetical protein